MLKQVSIFSEKQKGAFQSITGILQEENINILGSVTNDSAEYGIVRMIVSDTDKALKALSAHGYLCRATDILGVEMADEIGSLNRLLISLSEGNISVDYIYLCFNRDSGMPVLILHTDDIWEVEEYLKAKGFSLQ